MLELANLTNHVVWEAVLVPQRLQHVLGSPFPAWVVQAHTYCRSAAGAILARWCAAECSTAMLRAIESSQGPAPDAPAGPSRLLVTGTAGRNARPRKRLTPSDRAHL